MGMTIKTKILVLGEHNGEKLYAAMPCATARTTFRIGSLQFQKRSQGGGRENGRDYALKEVVMKYYENKL